MDIDELADGLPVLEPRGALDHAIIGVATRANDDRFVVYDQDKCIKVLGVEWFHYNTLRSWVGDGTPAFLVRGDSNEDKQRELRALVAQLDISLEGLDQDHDAVTAFKNLQEFLDD